MSQGTNQPKVYLDVVEKIRQLIDQKQLLPGDKLPSERELAEQLSAARSSIREALRALELLGLIETRRGDGTFVTDFRNHRLVELLGRFILNNGQAQHDVVETKELLEIAGISSIIKKQQKVDFSSICQQDFVDEDVFFNTLIQHADNRLLGKIWYILASFNNTLNREKRKVSKTFINHLQDAINEGDEQKAVNLYRNELN